MQNDRGMSYSPGLFPQANEAGFDEGGMGSSFCLHHRASDRRLPFLTPLSLPGEPSLGHLGLGLGRFATLAFEPLARSSGKPRGS